MTVGELITELARYPSGLPVKIVLSEIVGGHDDTGRFNDELVQVLDIGDALEARAVVFEGTHVLIESV